MTANRHWRKTRAALVLLALSVQAAPAAGAPGYLVGGAKALWLVLVEDDSYRLAVKLPDRPWAKLPGEAEGEVAAVTVVADTAMVFFNSGRSVRYFPYRQEEQQQPRPPQSLWPANTRVLSACAAGPADSAALVLVSRPVAPATTTRPAEPAVVTAAVVPVASELALLRLEGGRWQQVAIVDGEVTGWAGRAHIASAGGRAYVLLDLPKRRLLVIEQGRWNKLPLPEEAIAGRVLAMMAVKDQLLLAVFGPAGQGRVGLARLVSGAWEQVQFLTAADGPLAWPAEDRPVVGRVGQVVALARQEQDKWLVSEFDLQGRRLQPPEDIFAMAGAVESAGKLKEYFLWGVLLLLIVLVFWPGQTLRTLPFSLPATMRPARLGKRGVAFAIDVAPFAGVAYYLAGGSTDVAAFVQMMQEGPRQVEIVHALLGFLIAYPAYCVLLEYLFGATFGKMAMRLRVVGGAGKRPGLREIALRNISKIPEILFMVFVLPLLFPLLTRYRQRLGDKIAWTAVIDVELGPPTEGPQDASQPPRAGADRDEEEEKL